VLRHSEATSIDIQLRQENGHMELQVIDNGKGISDLERVNAGSLGILGMKERALLVGGEVNITGSAGAGTTVRVRVPVETCGLE
jgi:signal transduction histidine kinase